jgi:serine/threonine protein kinase, bacterial
MSGSGFRLCHQGHSNPLSNRYCYQCGASLTDSKEMIERVVGDRYRILRDIGHGGFGQTYLAEDSNRFNEPCVLKELAPSAENQDTLEKAKELFTREAEVLYKLQHPQIPRFREWFVEPTRQSMFLVQDYVEGPTYQEILRDRQPQTFSESEVVTLLTQLLPVLSYIHGRGVVHRDLSPDNLICRNSDRLPVLIDFGGVKAGTASVSQSVRRAQAEVAKPNITLIGKLGYSPEEQMRQGQVSAASDLYALGVTALVLLTGQEPADLYDSFHLKFDWHNKAQVSPGMTAILDKMVAYKVSDRYTSAVQVLQDIKSPSSPPQATPQGSSPQETSLPLGSETVGSSKTLVVAPMGTAIASEIVLGSASSDSLVPNSPGPLAGVKKIPGLIWSGTLSLVRSLLVLLLLVGAGVLGWVAVRSWLQMQQRNFTTPNPVSTQSYSQTEKQRKAQLLSRIGQSSVPSSFFYRLVNEAYYLQYPEQRGQLLGNGPEDESRRTNWDQVALQSVTLTEQLSPNARNRLGSYTSSDRAQWSNQLRRKNINARQIYQQAETRLVNALPVYKGTNIHEDPTTSAYQLLNGLIDDQIQEIVTQ